MKKFVLFLALAIVVSLTTSAQTAKQILDKTAAAMSSKGGARANFSMSGKYGNVSGRVKNLIQFETIINKIKTGEIELAELIVNKNVSTYSFGINSFYFDDYDFDKNYKVVFAYI